MPDDDDSGSLSGDEASPSNGTLRPSDLRRLHLTSASAQSQVSSASSTAAHRRLQSGKSDMTITGRDGGDIFRSGSGSGGERGHGHGRSDSKDDLGGDRSRSDSLTSLAPTMGSSDRGREHGFKTAREVDECEMRDDMVAWRLPGSVA
jgi:hypothetical protein